MTKVSVIVPVYNVEKYLQKCLNSLVNQTLPEMEIIVVNDGSTDGSAAIIADFSAQFPKKIKSYTKPNGGLSDARNYGLERGTGKYIGFVDSDDYVTENMFEEMYLLAEKHHAEMVICNLQKVNQDGEVTQKLTQIPHLPEKIILKDHFSVFSDLSYFACNKLFKKDLFEGKTFKKGVHFEDIQLIPQLLLKCTTLAQTQNYHYQYLERTDSITKTHTEKGLDILKSVEDVETAFKTSKYAAFQNELKGFQILEGVYTFLAYLAYVKNPKISANMFQELKLFMKKRNITFKDVAEYQRFGRNYLQSLHWKKRMYYFLYFLGLEKLTRALT